MVNYTKHHRRVAAGVVEYLCDGVPHRFALEGGGKLCRQIGDSLYASVPLWEAAALHAAGVLDGLDYRPQSALALRVAEAVRRRLAAGDSVYSFARRSGVHETTIRRLLAGGEIRTDSADALLRACEEA